MKITNMTQEEKIEYLTTQPIPRLVSQMAIPTIISMLVSSFYNMADTFFVGKLNTQATGAVGVTFAVMALIQALGFFFGHGSGNYISRKLGAHELKLASVMASVGFFSAFIAGIFVTVFGLLFLQPLSLLLGSTPTILPYTMSYLGIILLGAPFMMSSLVLNNQLRFQGSASFAMVGIVTGAVINIALDPILIFGFHLGINGAAIATAVSQLISFLILFSASRKGGNIQIQFKNFKPGFFYYKEIFRGGIPSLFRQGLASVAQISMNHAAGICAGPLLADAAIAGMSVVNRIMMFANSALIGFGQGFQPVCGMNYGAAKYRRVREAYYFCVKTAIGFLIVISLIGIIFAEPIVTIFRKDDADVIKIGTLALRLQCLTFPLNSWIVMCNMLLQSIGKAFRASLVSAARQGLFFLPLIWILPYVIGLLGVQITQPIADGLSFMLSIPLGVGVLKELKESD